MTRKEALLTVLAGGIPDRVPVTPLIHMRYAHQVLGRSDWRAVFELHQRLGSTDFRGMCGVGVSTQMPDGYERTSELRTEADGRTITTSALRTPGGVLTGEHVIGMIPHDPMVGKKTVYEVKDTADWDIYLDYLQRAVESPYSCDVSGAREHWDVMGADGVASVGMSSVFTSVGDARGLEQLLVDLYDCPDVIDEVFSLQRQLHRRAIEAFLEAPNEVLYYDICWATGAHMGPRLFERWMLPEMVQVCDMVRERPNKYVVFYTLGRIRELLPIMADAGPDGIETFEQNEGDITLADAKRLYGDRITLFGNFDCLVLAFGTREQAVREAMRCLDEGMEGGRYVMATADEVPADTKWDNLQAMVDTAMQHGAY